MTTLSNSNTHCRLSDKNFYFVFFPLVILIAFLYMILIGGRYVWADEAYTFGMIRHSFSEIWNITAADVHPPLYYFILKILTMPFHYSLVSAKVVSVIPFLFIVVFGGIQFKKLFNAKTGIIFSVLFFLFPFTLSYAVEIRMYSWAATFVFGNAVYAYRCYLEDRKSNWIFFVLFGVCSAYTHYFSLVSTGIVYGLLMLAILIRQRKKIVLWVISVIFTVVLYLPWMSCFVEQLIYKVENDYWISPITLNEIIGYYGSIFGANGVSFFYFSASFLYLLALILIIKNKKRCDIVLSLCILAVPVGTIGVGILASLLVRPVFVIRYVVPSMPLLVSFMSIVLGKTENKILLTVMLTILIGGGIINYISTFFSEYATTENALDESFLSSYEDTDCYIVLAESSDISVHISSVLAYYEPQKPIYRFGEKSDANPFDNHYSLELFSFDKNDAVLMFLGVGEIPQKEWTSQYSYKYLGEVNECGKLADVYLLER